MKTKEQIENKDGLDSLERLAALELLDGDIKQSKGKYVIKLATLKKLSKLIFQLASRIDLANFFVSCGVETDLCNHPQHSLNYSNEDFLDDIGWLLQHYVESDKPERNNVIFKIIERLRHPSLHNFDEKIADKYAERLNKILKLSGYYFKFYKLN